VVEKVQATFEARRKRYIGDNQDGTIANEIKQSLAQVRGEINENHLLSLLFHIPQGTRTVFDRKTKQRVYQRSTRLVFTYYASRLLESVDPEDANDQILTHLQQAQANTRRAIGIGELNGHAKSPVNTLPRPVRRRLQAAFGEEKYARVETQLLSQFSGDDIATLIDELGGQILTQTYRQLMLRVIDSLWIEYPHPNGSLARVRWVGSLRPTRSAGDVQIQGVGIVPKPDQRHPRGGWSPACSPSVPRQVAGRRSHALGRC
jgi:hypothetical protein